MSRLPALLFTALCSLFFSASSSAAPTVTRLTPPSQWFATGEHQPMIARFLPGQRFDLQATIQADPGQHITGFRFLVDGQPITATPGHSSLVNQPTLLAPQLSLGSAVVSLRAYAHEAPGVHRLRIEARQSDGLLAVAEGEFEVVTLQPTPHPVKNIIFFLGDGMGLAHRSAARIVGGAYSQGKARQLLTMDQFPYSGFVMTASLNSIVTDSSAGMSNYMTGNKAHNGQIGVWPDDTIDPFDNPRVEYLSEYLHRTRGTILGVVTTANVSDATPAATSVHSAQRQAGTGIVDQFLDDRHLTGLSLLLGGGRHWFQPQSQAGAESKRRASSDYQLPSDVTKAWHSQSGRIDPERNLIQDFQHAGFRYVSTQAQLQAAVADGQRQILGLFAPHDMDVALDKITARRAATPEMRAYGLDQQPMLDEMTDAALQMLSRHPQGFIAMIEGSSIDKQAHALDSDRWLLEVLEFDRAIAVARRFADQHPDTLVIVTADHECSGAAIIGAAKINPADLDPRTAKNEPTLQRQVVGIYDQAHFPQYRIQADGYPEHMDIKGKLLIGYGANGEHHETWRSAPWQSEPQHKQRVLNTLPGVDINGNIPGSSGAHTAIDVPLSAYGAQAQRFTGVMDNTDVFFKMAESLGLGR